MERWTMAMKAKLVAVKPQFSRRSISINVIYYLNLKCNTVIKFETDFRSRTLLPFHRITQKE